ncbi:SRPBCC domain-containing protein [bacterium]|nr:SRPBCC domain-containing protein [bacterium]
MTLRQTQSLHIERLFDCTPEDLWAAWTTPEEFASWICPFPGLDAVVHELDPRPGGRLAFTLVCPDGVRFYEDGVFEVVNRPHELVIYQPHAPHENRNDFFAGYPLTIRVQFKAEGDQTRMVFEHSGYPLDTQIDGARNGFRAAFDKLATALA